MQEMLVQVEDKILHGSLQSIVDIGISLAALCASIAMIGIGKRFMGGQAFNWNEFIRPILIFFLVCNFQTFVLNPIRGIAGMYDTRLAGAVGGSVEEFKSLFREESQRMCHDEFGDDGKDAFTLRDDDNFIVSFVKKTANKVVASFFQLNESLNYGAAVVISGVLYFIMNMTTSIMIIIANIYLIIMALIGPFTFALSILPAYPNGITLWIERYIQYTLWEPLLYIVLYIGTQIMILGNQSFGWGGFWTWAFMIISVFIVIKQVPGIASFIIEGSGTESLANQMSGVGGNMLSKAQSISSITH